jgi:hypothetical protein
MRVALLVYGLFLLAGELVGSRLALIGWGQVTGLDVASAVADAALAVAVVLAVLLSAKLTVRRCRRWLRRRTRSRLVESLRPAPPIAVRSSREPAQDDTPTEVRTWPAFLSGYRLVSRP